MERHPFLEAAIFIATSHYKVTPESIKKPIPTGRASNLEIKSARALYLYLAKEFGMTLKYTADYISMNANNASTEYTWIKKHLGVSTRARVATKFNNYLHETIKND